MNYIKFSFNMIFYIYNIDFYKFDGFRYTLRHFYRVFRLVKNRPRLVNRISLKFQVLKWKIKKEDWETNELKKTQ